MANNITQWSVSQTISGATTVQIEISDPSGSFIKALEYAVTNGLPMPIPTAGFAYSQGETIYPQIYNLDVKHVDATTFGDARKSYLTVATLTIEALLVP